MSWLDNPIVIGLILGTPTLVFAYLNYRKSVKATKKAEGAETVAQIIAGLNSLTTNLQNDNATLREQITKLLELPEEIEKLKREIHDLKRELSDLKRNQG